LGIDRKLLTKATPLVQLRREFFSAPSSRHPDFVPSLVRDIQRILGIEAASIEVLPLDQIDGRFRHEYQALVGTGGTWQGEGNSALIRYNPDLVARPITLIATLAHEVMHHVLRSLPDLPPGGEEAEELSTDLHCITMGFGVFQLAGAEEIGWHGYLRQPSRAHALAMFLRMRGVPETEALSSLPPRCRGYLKAALAWIDRNDPGLSRRLS
jgi:hypothetical protein